MLLFLKKTAALVADMAKEIHMNSIQGIIPDFLLTLEKLMAFTLNNLLNL